MEKFEQEESVNIQYLNHRGDDNIFIRLCEPRSGEVIQRLCSRTMKVAGLLRRCTLCNDGYLKILANGCLNEQALMKRSVIKVFIPPKQKPSIRNP